MKVLLTGAAGQLGCELVRSRPAGVDLVALTRAELDVTSGEQVASVVERVSPQVILNAAAFTAVDRAEDEEPRARAVNARGTANLAASAGPLDCRLIQISTDFVFDGRGNRPLGPDDPTEPLSVYGRTKLAGERSALEALGRKAAVIRTSWLYSAHGRNFVTRMLQLMTERDVLRVVDDQKGSPTWAAGLARALWLVAARPDLHGVWHWADAGSCTWFEFAQAIQREGLERGLLEREIRVEPVPTSEFPTAAARPAYSVLDTSATGGELGIEPVPWNDALGRMLDEMSEKGGRQ